MGPVLEFQDERCRLQARAARSVNEPRWMYVEGRALYVCVCYAQTSPHEPRA
jgi:hypothetical protein